MTKKRIVFIINKEDEMDLFELLYKNNIKFIEIPLKKNTYELNMEEMTRP